MSRKPLIVLLAVLPLAACGTVRDAVGTPQMNAIAYPAPLVPSQQQVLVSTDDGPRPASANSLWRNGARAFFHDQRASKIGDILTVNIDIDDRAKVQNETVANHKSGNSFGVPHLLGLESSLGRVLPRAFDPANAVGTSTSSSSDGIGSVNRAEAVSLTIAAVVTGVLPNGNMIIEGRQEVRVNNELRELTIAGLVRPEDITSSNTIKHTQIAEARVSYGGKGALSNVQRVPAGQALLQRFSPF
jgi:flagellar L-ring protein precursor FlgH